MVSKSMVYMAVSFAPSADTQGTLRQNEGSDAQPGDGAKGAPMCPHSILFFLKRLLPKKCICVHFFADPTHDFSGNMPWIKALALVTSKPRLKVTANSGSIRDEVLAYL